ncbi:hypothetical protein D9M68_541830 [compost metagenome]
MRDCHQRVIIVKRPVVGERRQAGKQRGQSEGQRNAALGRHSQCKGHLLIVGKLLYRRLKYGESLESTNLTKNSPQPWFVSVFKLLSHGTR